MPSTTTSTYHVTEATHWLRTRLGQIIEGCAVLGLNTESSTTTIVVPLGRTGAPGTREDRSCDRCGTYVPPGSLLYGTKHQVRPALLVVGALCPDCADREVGQAVAR